MRRERLGVEEIFWLSFKIGLIEAKMVKILKVFDLGTVFEEGLDLGEIEGSLIGGSRNDD